MFGVSRAWSGLSVRVFSLVCVWEKEGERESD